MDKIPICLALLLLVVYLNGAFCFKATILTNPTDFDRNTGEADGMEAFTAALIPSSLPEKQVVIGDNANSKDNGETLTRNRRGYRSYFYNYLDEMAMSICASIPSEGPGLLYAVRRTCGENATCQEICKDAKLRKQGPKEVQNLQWTCSESLHVYKRQPALADNYEDYTDSHKLGLAIYRHNSCKIGGCGPNYCCCRAS